ncbi:MAG: BMP family ABC transporter substrate-binding protein [Clostridia bacterium]|nr:BMP family ABC transporter substrate-binding protein [Clostridia bacterium]
MKKLLTLVLALLMAVGCVGFAGCGNNGDDESKPESKDPVVGLICLHGESSTYDKNFIDAFKTACANKKVGYKIVVDIDESQECFDAAEELIEEGCKVLFADSFGHEQYMMAAAEEHPDIEFCHATGTQAKQSDLANYHNAFASIYEGRYLAGYAAGLKLNTMKDQAVNNNFKVGYVGAFTYAEVISGYTSWFLGVQAALDEGYTATMEVTFTGSWYDEAGEKSAAETLISRGCVLVSQHADSMGAPTACENAGVPNVAYNGSTNKSTMVAYSRINWVPYFEHMIDKYVNHTIADDYCGTLANGAVEYFVAGAAAAEGTQAAVDAVKAKLLDGSLKVFDCSKFTVNGAHLTEYLADIDGNYEPDTNVIKTVNGVTYFDESNADEFRSAPYFDIAAIDGITLLNTNFG